MPVFSSILSTTRVSRCLAVQLANDVDLLPKGRVWAVQPLLDPAWPYVAGPQYALHVTAADLLDDAALNGTRRNLVERRRDPSLRFLRLTPSAVNFSRASCVMDGHCACPHEYPGCLDGQCACHRQTVCTDTPSSRGMTELECPSWAHNAIRARITSRCAAVFRSIGDSSSCRSLFASFIVVAWRPRLIRT
ncbi:hypothetical protein QF001_001699 [Paraburkholderia youngii]